MATLGFGEPGAAAVEADEADACFPCTLAQERFWLLDRIGAGTAALNVAVRWRLEGEVSAEFAQGAFARIIGRHEALRTAIVERDSVPVQVVAPAVALRLTHIDLCGWPQAQRMREAEAIEAREAGAPFDLARAPLMRATLLRLEARLCVLLVTMHRAVCDAWSIGVLAHEFRAYYEAIAAERAPELPELPIQYGDFARWQRAYLASEGFAPAREYWQRKLAGMKPFGLAPDRTRPPVQTDNGAILSVLLPRGIANALAALSREHRATMFTTALTGLLALLHRYTGEADIAIGTQVAGRDQVELEGLVGSFVNTVILRAAIDAAQPIAALLAQVRDTVQEALLHQQMPIEHLIALATPACDLGGNALFWINFTFQRSFIRNETCGDFVMVELPAQSTGAFHDLNFLVAEQPDGWRLSCEYNADLFDASTIEWMLAALRNVYRAMGKDSCCPVERLPLLTDAEALKVADCSNDTARSYPAGTTLTELISARAALMGEALAGVCGGEGISHGELDSASNRLARHLQARGIGPGMRVGICLDRSVGLVASLLAVMKAGAAYVPLDPGYPAPRLQQILDDADLVEIVTSTQAWPKLAHESARVTLLDWDAAEIAAQDAASLVASAGPDDVACVIFTSGSTGRPKRVQVTHRNLVNLLCAMRERPGLEAGDTLVSVSAVSFGSAALEMFLPLLVGARLVIGSAELADDGAALLALLQTWNATVLQATPATWKMLIEAGWNGVPRLRALCGGEALQRSLAERILARAGELWNMYGTTETTVWSSVLRVFPGEGPVPIGPPIANTQFHVLDANGSAMPPGAVGELHIGGEGVARGYLGRPDLTSAGFVPDTWCRQAGRRMYRTGDLMRRRPGGLMEFVGRADQQLKLCAFRVDLGEIEAASWVQPLGAGTPVIAINNTGLFHTLAGRIGSDRPFVAAQLRDPRVPGPLRDGSFEEIAAAYVQLIRAVRPHGPYVLLGLGVAGTIAFEAAQQLRAQGEQIELLVLIDGWAPGYLKRRGWLTSRIGVLRRLRVLKTRLIAEAPADPPDRWMLNQLTRALADYRPRPYAGRTLVFHCSEQPNARFLDSALGWAELCHGPFACLAIPGDHLALFQDPGASAMAERIRVWLGDAGT